MVQGIICLAGVLLQSAIFQDPGHYLPRPGLGLPRRPHHPEQQAMVMVPLQTLLSTFVGSLLKPNNVQKPKEEAWT